MQGDIVYVVIGNDIVDGSRLVYIGGGTNIETSKIKTAKVI